MTDIYNVGNNIEVANPDRTGWVYCRLSNAGPWMPVRYLKTKTLLSIIKHINSRNRFDAIYDLKQVIKEILKKRNKTKRR